MMRDVVHATLHREVYQRTSRGGVELLQHLPAVLDSMASLLRATLPLSLAGLGSLLGLATISWVLLAITAPWVRTQSELFASSSRLAWPPATTRVDVSPLGPHHARL